jgi:hypothetical protein
MTRTGRAGRRVVALSLCLRRDWHEKALLGLRTGKIKGTTIRVRRIDG